CRSRVLGQGTRRRGFALLHRHAGRAKKRAKRRGRESFYKKTPYPFFRRSAGGLPTCSGKHGLVGYARAFDKIVEPCQFSFPGRSLACLGPEKRTDTDSIFIGPEKRTDTDSIFN